MTVPFTADEVFSRMVALRRAIHLHPELAFEEAHTAGLIVAELGRLGIPHTYGGVGGAVAGTLAGAPGGNGPRVALRAEMDALPGDETTGLPFASEVPGRMHACGHDAHVAMVLGAAALLAADPPPGTVLFVFQPAEEHGGGARVVLESGVLEGVDAIFAGHGTHHYPTGRMMVAEGVITAHSDRFTLHVRGRGGHGARPHEAVDAVVIAAYLVTALQTLVSRETDPLHPSVVTVGQLNAGSAPNVIAEEALLHGTIRTTRREAREHIHLGIRRMARAMGELHNARVEVRIDEGYPPVVNTAREAAVARRAAERVVGAEGLAPMEHPSMGSEDFAFYLKRMPGCYVRFGTRAEGWPYAPLHSPGYDVDEEALKVGAAFFEQVAREAVREYTGERTGAAV